MALRHVKQAVLDVEAQSGQRQLSLRRSFNRLLGGGNAGGGAAAAPAVPRAAQEALGRAHLIAKRKELLRKRANLLSTDKWSKSFTIGQEVQWRNGFPGDLWARWHKGEVRSLDPVKVAPIYDDEGTTSLEPNGYIWDEVRSLEEAANAPSVAEVWRELKDVSEELGAIERKIAAAELPPPRKPPKSAAKTPGGAQAQALKKRTRKR